MFKHALVIGAETLSRFLDFSDRGTCILFGDGAGAVVLSASDEEGGGLQGLEMTTDPDGAYMIWLPSGGSRSPASGQTLARGEHYVRMEGRETYRYATKTMATTALKAIERAGWQPDEIDLFIPHQANVRIIESVAKGLGLPMEKMFVNVDRYGNTSAAQSRSRWPRPSTRAAIKIGDKVVLVAFGAGLTSAASRSSGRPIRSAASAPRSVEPVASVREPQDWSSVDPIPERLRRDPRGAGPPVPLDDVVPGRAQPAPRTRSWRSGGGRRGGGADSALAMRRQICGQAPEAAERAGVSCGERVNRPHGECASRSMHRTRRGSLALRERGLHRAATSGGVAYRIGSGRVATPDARRARLAGRQAPSLTSAHRGQTDSRAAKATKPATKVHCLRREVNSSATVLENVAR